MKIADRLKRVLDGGTDPEVCLFHCTNNRYFTTLEEALTDEQLKKAPALSGYRTRRRCAVPGGWDYYQVTFDENNIVISQETYSIFDGP